MPLTDGSAEALKWLAMLLMTGDHVNKYLFNGTLPVLFEVGRLALPIFIFVLSFNLARQGALERGVYMRTMRRLALFGALSTPPFIALGGLLSGWWPFNIMFTLLVITAIIYLLECDGVANYWVAITVFSIFGGLVEFSWPAIGFGLAVWSYIKKPSWPALGAALLCCTALWVFNHNMWALSALPLLLMVSQLNIQLPRIRWFFYAYYPLHLIVLWLIRIPLSNAGYIFLF